jgi:DNA polymerase III gamma/tau subunit
MHAYLFVGPTGSDFTTPVTKLAGKLKVKLMAFPLTKIEDARELKAFTSLKINEPTAIHIDSIDTASEETLNAFLKSLEEPQENLYFILTASSLSAVLPTIVSRCEVIRNSPPPEKIQAVQKQLPTLSTIDKIKDRGEAKELVENLISQLHHSLITGKDPLSETAENLEISVRTLNNLKANGNVNLQLTNLVINLT